MCCNTYAYIRHARKEREHTHTHTRVTFKWMCAVWPEVKSKGLGNVLRPCQHDTRKREKKKKRRLSYIIRLYVPNCSETKMHSTTRGVVVVDAPLTVT